MNKKQAEQLFEQLADALNNAERTITQIIENKAWEPLGYATFADAWDDRLKGVRLATMSMRAHVVYAMLEDGMTDEEAAGRATMNEESVAALRRQMALGVPAGSASTVVRRHTRNKPAAPYRVHIDLEPDELKRYRSLAEGRGLDFEVEVRAVVRKHFGRMQKVAS